MSKDVIVLTPSGRRQKVHCKPDTNILQILEEVCEKHGLASTEYALKHHNHTLDLSTTIRFSNLPNKATLEIVEADRKREESNVTIGLQLEDGERRTADFTPNTLLYDLVMKLAPGELNAIQQPTILYMRQEVIGVPALQAKSLRQLGLIQGRAILRLLNKAEEARQANVSAVYSVPFAPEEKLTNNVKEDAVQPVPDIPEAQPEVGQAQSAGPSNYKKKPEVQNFDPLKAVKQEKLANLNKEECAEQKDTSLNKTVKVQETPMEVDLESNTSGNSQSPFSTQEQLERRLQIENEVTFIGENKAIVFMQPDNAEDELVDLPDDFYELTIDEVRRLYHDLQKQRKEIENSPLLIASKKQELQEQTSSQRLAQYKHVVVRIQFPDRIILQGVFIPSNCVEDVSNFVRHHLQNTEKSFHLFTTPMKETLDLKKTLLDAGFVPGVHMHFKWAHKGAGHQYLKQEIYTQTTSSDAANILASKYRAPSRKRVENQASSSRQSAAGPSNTSNLPKWFKW